MKNLKEKQLGRNQTFLSTLEEVRFWWRGDSTKYPCPSFLTFPDRFLSKPNFLSWRTLINASPNLTYKQQWFVEEYQWDGNGSQAVLRAGYQTKYTAEMTYGLLRNTKVKHSLEDAQNARGERLQMQVDLTRSSTLNKKRRLLRLVTTRHP